MIHGVSDPVTRSLAARTCLAPGPLYVGRSIVQYCIYLITADVSKILYGESRKLYQSPNEH